MTRNVCIHEGYVVNGRELSTDPIDHDAEALPRIGCTNLRCGLCAARVRSAKDRIFASPGGLADIEALYDTPDLASSPQLKESAGWRIYACRCAYHVESNERRLDDKEGAQVATQWTCVGHPIATLPHAFDGVTVTEGNLEALVADSMKGTLPASVRASDRNDGVWAARLCTRLAKTPYAGRVMAEVAKHLADPDLATRVRALYAFSYVPSHAAAMRADVLLGKHAELFVGVANPQSNARVTKTLEFLIWRIAGAQLATDAALRDVAHAFALDPQRSSRALFIALARDDRAWFCENAAKLAAANPTKTSELADVASNAMLPDSVIAAFRR